MKMHPIIWGNSLLWGKALPYDIIKMATLKSSWLDLKNKMEITYSRCNVTIIIMPYYNTIMGPDCFTMIFSLIQCPQSEQLVQQFQNFTQLYI